MATQYGAGIDDPFIAFDPALVFLRDFLPVGMKQINGGGSGVQFPPLQIGGLLPAAFGAA